MNPSPRPQPLPLEALHPALWRAHQLGAQRTATTSTGFAELDVQLPGGGWPHRVLCELLLPHPGLGEMRLLAPALAALAQAGHSVMLFDPPAALCAWALAQLGVDARQLLVVHGREGARGAATLRHLLPSADVLWALEQSLKSGSHGAGLGAVLAWLPPRLPTDALRRLQLAAQGHDGPAFMLREAAAAQRPSVAPLRLALQPAGSQATDWLAVRVLKRRGPQLAEPIALALPPVLPLMQVDSALPQPGPGSQPPERGASPTRRPLRPRALS